MAKMEAAKSTRFAKQSKLKTRKSKLFQHKEWRSFMKITIGLSVKKEEKVEPWRMEKEGWGQVQLLESG